MRHGRRRLRRSVTVTTAALASVTLVASLAMAPAHATTVEGAYNGPSTAVESQVRDEVAAGGTTDFWVYVREHADLAAAPSITDRTEQGEHVIEQLTAAAERGQADLRALLDSAGASYESFWIANAVKVTGDAELLQRIEALPQVAEVTADRTYELPEPAPAQEQPQVDSVEWGVDRINAPQVWDTFGATGAGIVVGTIDSGAHYQHPALVNQYRGNIGDNEFDHNYNWHDPSQVCGEPSVVPCDNSGHGTHVVGTIVGDDDGDNRIGVAPESQWIAAKGCEDRNCSQAALLSSGQFMLAPTDLNGHEPRPDLRPHVVNNSWGGGADTDPWYQATVEAWIAAGIFPQFANGNWTNPGSAPCGTSSNPGNLPESYAAGAFDINDDIASFSHRGPSAWGSDVIKPNIAAPGVAVRSAGLNNNYEARSGTSMAAPHVAGTVALMWSAAITLERDVDATRKLLDQGATSVEDLSCGGTAEKNNVWGHGALDAFAAVEAAPRGPVGTLTGTVHDAENDRPVGSAQVSITGEMERDEVTAPDGTYEVWLPAGEYEVSVSAFGYQSRTVGATVVTDETGTADVPLTAVDSVTISGEVTDGSGHGWPLHTRVEVLDTPVATYTDPLTGQYSTQVPAQETYTLRFESQYPGYETATTTVSVEAEDATADLALQVGQCQQAPGYEFSGDIAVLDSTSNPRLAPYLEEQGIPVDRLGWGDDPTPYDLLIINSPGFASGQPLLDVLDATDDAGTSVLFLDSQSNGTGIWLLNSTLGNPASRTGGFGNDIPYLYYEAVEEHPILDGLEVGERVVFEEADGRKNYAWFDGYEGEGRQVIAHAGRADTGTLGPGIGVQERESNRHVLLSMHADSGWASTDRWTEEAEQLFHNAMQWLVPEAAFECVRQDGGLMLGQVTDQNTDAGLIGATVATDTSPQPATSFAPADPGLDDGFFWLFSDAGTQDLTASAKNYIETSRSVEVSGSKVTEVDFELPAGRLLVEPDAIDSELRLGQEVQQTFTIRNDGTGPAQVSLTELPDSFKVLDAAPASSGEVQYVEGEFSTAAPTFGTFPMGAQSSPSHSPAAPPWTDITNYPLAVMDNAAVKFDGRLYSFGGYTGIDALSATQAYMPQSGLWHEAASMPAPRMKPEAVEIDGLIYVVGGWDGESGATDTTFIYDPEDNSWSQGADMPAERAAPGAAALDGKLYVVGGCPTAQCAPMSNTVFSYDPGADQWETLASYPRSAAWLGCAGLSDELICAGGHDGADPLASTFAYDPGSDSWSQRASLPYTNWAMGYATANGQLVVTGGIAGTFATNRSATYSPSQDMWVDIEPANVPVYRGAAACGLYRVGGSLVDINPVAHGERHPEFDNCTQQVEVPWLSADIDSLTLAPGQNANVTVTLDADAVEQPGKYAAGLEIVHDTPYEVASLSVTMTVNPPNDWGRITGTVHGMDCFGGSMPLANAPVVIEGRYDQIQLSTGPDGRYDHWLPARNGQLTVLASATGHLPQQVRSQVAPRSQTVEHFHLQPIC